MIDISNMYKDEVLAALYNASQPQGMGMLHYDQGEIYKCGFGVWDYDNISRFTEGGFAKRFKEFNTKFYNVFISSCAVCRRSYRRVEMKEEKE